ncbi:MAG: hypothetical protein WCL38_01685 [Actinomycetota bacterium]
MNRDGFAGGCTVSEADEMIDPLRVGKLAGKGARTTALLPA